MSGSKYDFAILLTIWGNLKFLMGGKLEYVTPARRPMILGTIDFGYEDASS
jgi:hypothetical protein